MNNIKSIFGVDYIANLVCASYAGVFNPIKKEKAGKEKIFLQNITNEQTSMWFALKKSHELFENDKSTRMTL